MIPRIMDDNIPYYNLVNDDTCLGYLPEAMSCIVHEARNGEYTGTVTLPITARHFDKLHEGGILKLKPNDKSDLQLFRINAINKTLSGNVTLTCNHISYDLKKVAVGPFSATGIQNVLTEIGRKTIGTTPFTIVTDIVNTTSKFKLEEPKNYREVLGGTEGSLLDVFSGPGGYCEFEFDNLVTHVWAHRGEDRGVVIEYGKNLIDITQDYDVSSVYTHIVGYCKKDNTVIVGDIVQVTPVQIPKTFIVDLTDKLEENETPTVARVTQLTKEYVNQNDITVPNIDITISMRSLRNTDQYDILRELETIHLCDYVTVRVPFIGIETLVEVIELDYDMLNEEISSITLGNSTKSLATTISNLSKK